MTPRLIALSLVFFVAATMVGVACAEDVDLCAIVGGGYYHRCKCKDLKGVPPEKIEKITLAEAAARRLFPHPDCAPPEIPENLKPTPTATATPTVEPTPKPKAVLVCPAKSMLRDQPNATAKVLATIDPLEVLYLMSADNGWAKVKRDSDAKEGYVSVTPATLEQQVPLAAALDVLLRLEAVRRNHVWPLAVKLDIARGQVKRGFTVEQVRLAFSGMKNQRGTPDTTKTVQTATGAAERWIFGKTSVTIKNDRVTDVGTTDAN